MFIFIVHLLKAFILLAVGAETDDDRIQLLLSEVKGKDITELIASGREKLASVPSGGGAVAVAAPGAGAGAAAPAAAEPKKEEKVEEKEDTDDVSFSWDYLIKFSICACRRIWVLQYHLLLSADNNPLAPTKTYSCLKLIKF